MKRLAIMYDWDQTLSPKYMSEFGLIKPLGFSCNEEYWNYCNNVITKKYNMENELSFLYSIIEGAKKQNFNLNRDYMHEVGSRIEYYNGVEGWFDRINEFGKKHDVIVEHYIISSGIYEIIEGSKIFPKFTKVFASSFAYDSDGRPFWPAFSVNYTNKTQYIFRIKKNLIHDLNDDGAVNRKYRKKDSIPYSNMIYIGDGLTDIPCMKIIKEYGGNSICLYEKGGASENKAKTIKREGRVNFVAEADYSENSDIDKIVKHIIEKL